jgi:hypothetical protein
MAVHRVYVCKKSASESRCTRRCHLDMVQPSFGMACMVGSGLRRHVIEMNMEGSQIRLPTGRVRWTRFRTAFSVIF